jgi:hypothetical protein
MGKTSNRPDEQSDPQHACGATARIATGSLTSHRIAALPILDRLLRRLRLEVLLRDHLPREDSRCRVPTATALLILIKNLLISREPLYGVGEWAARYLPQLLASISTARFSAPESVPACSETPYFKGFSRILC